MEAAERTISQILIEKIRHEIAARQTEMLEAGRSFWVIK